MFNQIFLNLHALSVSNPNTWLSFLILWLIGLWTPVLFNQINWNVNENANSTPWAYSNPSTLCPFSQLFPPCSEKSTQKRVFIGDQMGTLAPMADNTVCIMAWKMCTNFSRARMFNARAYGTSQTTVVIHKRKGSNTPVKQHSFCWWCFFTFLFYWYLLVLFYLSNLLKPVWVKLFLFSIWIFTSPA